MISIGRKKKLFNDNINTNANSGPGCLSKTWAAWRLPSRSALLLSSWASRDHSNGNSDYGGVACTYMLCLDAYCSIYSLAFLRLCVSLLQTSDFISL